jgi:hypothetical protein
MSAPRFDLTAIQVANVMDMLASIGVDDDDRLVLDTLEGETDLFAMLSKLVGQIEDDEGVIATLKEQQDSRKHRIASAEARIARARIMVGRLMDFAQRDKIVLPEATLSRRTVAAKLEIVDKDAVPRSLQREKLEPDKAAIDLEYSDADTLPNWLTRIPESKSVTVRRK